MLRFRVHITRKPGLADPEGSVTTGALRSLGFEEVHAVHFGRALVVEVDGDDAAIAMSRVEDMCRKLLANPVIEDFSIEPLDVT